MTNEEYIRVCKDNWPNLLAMVRDYHPASKAFGKAKPMNITAGAAESACAKVRLDIQQEYDKFVDVVADAEKALREADCGELCSIFNETWFGIPESLSAWELPGFGVLCDLCSEYEPPHGDE